MKRFHLLAALLLAGGLSFSTLNAAPSAPICDVTLEVGGEPTLEERMALRNASLETPYTYNDLLDKYARQEATVIPVDRNHCQVCIMTSPGHFIIIDIEDEE